MDNGQEAQRTHKEPSFAYALAVFLLCMVVLAIGLAVFKAKLQVLFLIVTIVSVPFAMKLGFTYKEVESAALDFTRRAMQVVMIMFAVGAMIATWIACGAIPLMIYIGLKIISPAIYLFASLIVCSIASVITGSSTAAMGTVGIAFLGIGLSMGIPIGPTIASIVCGAAFGDKMSPLSDSTLLCSALAEVEVIDHVKHMLYTTTPAYIITAVIYLIMGFKYAGTAVDTEAINVILVAIEENFYIGIPVLIPVVIVVVLLVMKKPAFPSIMIGAITALIIALVAQGDTIKSLLTSMWGGYTMQCGIPAVDSLFSKGGINSMSGTVLTILFAFMFAGVLFSSGIISAVTKPAIKICNTDGNTILVTAILAYGIGMIGSMNMSQVLTGTIMRPIYEERKMKGENLSRCLEDFQTFGAALIPWSTYAIFVCSIFSCSTEYIPYCFLFMLTPIFDIIFGYTGFSITHTYDVKKTKKKRIKA